MTMTSEPKHRHALGVEFWSYAAPSGSVVPGWERQRWRWSDGRTLHKLFVRAFGRVLCFAWWR